MRRLYLGHRINHGLSLMIVICKSWSDILYDDISHVVVQGSHESLKTWKVLEFENWGSRPGKSWIFVEVLENPGIWTYRSIFLIRSIQEFSRYSSSEIWVYLCIKSLWIHWKGPWIWHGKVLENHGIWDVYEPCYCIHIFLNPHCPAGCLFMLILN